MLGTDGSDSLRLVAGGVDRQDRCTLGVRGYLHHRAGVSRNPLLRSFHVPEVSGHAKIELRRSAASRPAHSDGRAADLADSGGLSSVLTAGWRSEIS